MRPGCSGDYHREDVRPCCSLYRPSSPTRGVLIAPLYYRPARVLTRLRALCDGSSEKSNCLARHVAIARSALAQTPRDKVSHLTRQGKPLQ